MHFKICLQAYCQMHFTMLASIFSILWLMLLLWNRLVALLEALCALDPCIHVFVKYDVCVFFYVCVCHGWTCIRQPQQRRNAWITQSQQQSDPNTQSTHLPSRPHLIHSLQPTTPPTVTWPRPMQLVHESKDMQYMKYANYSTHPSIPILPSNVPMVWDFHGSVCCSALQCVAVCCSVLHCVAVCCSVLQCVAVCCSVLQCMALLSPNGRRSNLFCFIRL